MDLDQSRFDSVAHARQQRLAILVLLANLAIIFCAALLYDLYEWDPEIAYSEWWAMAALFCISWVNLLVSAGAVGGIADVLSVLAPDSSVQSRFDNLFLARRRMVFFYAGIFTNIVGIALLTEVTGGLGESPMVPLFVAFLLIGPQLSRFKTQAIVFLVVGLGLTVSMVICERWASLPSEPAPSQLTIGSVMLALLIGGVLTWLEKPYSYLIPKRIHPPSRARIYCDGAGNWRFYLLQRSHRQDPILSVHKTDGTDGEFPADLKQNFNAYSIRMAEGAGWGKAVPTWPNECTDSFLVELAYESDQGNGVV